MRSSVLEAPENDLFSAWSSGPAVAAGRARWLACRQLPRSTASCLESERVRCRALTQAGQHLTAKGLGQLMQSLEVQE